MVESINFIAQHGYEAQVPAIYYGAFQLFSGTIQHKML